MPGSAAFAIAQFARESPRHMSVAEQVSPSDGGIGFAHHAFAGCARDAAVRTGRCRRCYAPCAAAAGLDRAWLADDLAPAVRRRRHPRLSDAGLVKLISGCCAASASGSDRRQRLPATAPGRNRNAAPAQPGRDRAGATTCATNSFLRLQGRMGFGEEELDTLKHPELVSMLVNATRLVVLGVGQPPEVLKPLLRPGATWAEIATVDRMLPPGRGTRWSTASTA